MRVREYLQQSQRILRQQHPLALAEYSSIFCSAVGTAIAVLLREVAYATFPLTVALAFNVANRQRLDRDRQEQMTHYFSQVNTRLSEVTQTIAPPPQPPIERPTNELQEELAKLQLCITILESKTNFLNSKLQEKLSSELSAIRQDISSFTEPFNLDNIERKIQSLNSAVQSLLERPLPEWRQYEQLKQSIGQMETNQRELIWPQIKQLNADLESLKKNERHLNQKLDNLLEKFNARPEVPQLSRLKRTVHQLSDRLSQVQQTEVFAKLFDEIEQLNRKVEWLANKMNE